MESTVNDNSLGNESQEESKFAGVVFHNVQDFGRGIRCYYSIKPWVSTTAHDWIGLYKVGWQSPKDYLCYEYSPVIENSAEFSSSSSLTHSLSSQNSVVFRGEKLPSDECEFYQFCYVTSNGGICGASYPFQIRYSEEDMSEKSTDQLLASLAKYLDETPESDEPVTDFDNESILISQDSLGVEERGFNNSSNSASQRQVAEHQEQSSTQLENNEELTHTNACFNNLQHKVDMLIKWRLIDRQKRRMIASSVLTLQQYLEIDKFQAKRESKTLAELIGMKEAGIINKKRRSQSIDTNDCEIRLSSERHSCEDDEPSPSKRRHTGK